MAQLTQEEVQERLKNLTPDQVQELVKQQCVFCKIVAGEIPCYKVYEDNNFLAFLDASPVNPGHTLIIPKQHFSVLPQLPDNLTSGIFVLVKKLSAIIFEATGAEGVNILQNNGQVAGQAVPHVHIHLIPRFTNDGLSFSNEPKKLEEEQFKEIQARILKRLKEPTKSKEVPKQEAPPKEEKPKLPRIKSRLP